MGPQLSGFRWGTRIIYGDDRDDDDGGGGYDNARGASLCSVDDLPNQGTGNRHIIVAGSRTSRWPHFDIIWISTSRSLSASSSARVNQVLVSDRIEIRYKSEESGHHCQSH